MKPRFQADYDFNQDIVAGVIRREPRIDFQTGHTAGLKGRSDDEVLELAAQESRILVTHGRRTMSDHFAHFITRRNSPGVLILSQKTDLDTAIEELILIWTVTEAEEWVNIICPIPL
jgi:hypothetical protein